MSDAVSFGELAHGLVRICFSVRRPIRFRGDWRAFIERGHDPRDRRGIAAGHVQIAALVDAAEFDQLAAARSHTVASDAERRFDFLLGQAVRNRLILIMASRNGGGCPKF